MSDQAAVEQMKQLLAQYPDAQEFAMHFIIFWGKVEKLLTTDGLIKVHALAKPQLVKADLTAASMAAKQH